MSALSKGKVTLGTLVVIATAAMAGTAFAQTIRIAGPTGVAVKALTEDIIPAFEAATGIKVEATFAAHEALTQKAMTEFVAGSPSFDVVMFETSWGGRYSPFLEDLGPLVAAAGDDFDVDDILPGARNLGVYDGKTIGIPYRVTGRMLHYRKDLFDEAGLSGPPETLDQLLEYAQALTKDTNGDGEPDVYGLGILGKQGYGNAYEYGTFLFSRGGAWWDLETCEVLFDNETGIEAMEFYASLIRTEKVVPPEVTTWAWDEWTAGGQNGRYAMSIMHTPYAISLEDPTKSQTAGKWAWAPAPGATPELIATAPVGGWLLGITAASPEKENAWRFIEFATGAESQLKSAFNLNSPTRASAFQNEEVRKMWPWADVALQTLDTGTPMYNNPEELEAESALMVRVSEALATDRDPREIAVEAAEQLRMILRNSGRCS